MSQPSIIRLIIVSPLIVVAYVFHICLALITVTAAACVAVVGITAAAISIAIRKTSNR